MSGASFTLASALLVIAVVLLAYLSLFAVAMLVIAGLARRPRGAARRKVNTRPRGEVAVLVPAHHEGESLLDTVETLLHQDYQGMVRIYLLVADEEDSAVAPLYARYPQRRVGDRVVLKQSKKRELILWPLGVSPKRDKLNLALERLEEPLVAFLDADHRAEASWLSSALTVMEEEDAPAVQSRRRALATQYLPQVWDSVQNHVGNEALNHAVARLGGGVAFTGTTALFRAEVLRGRRFADCVTEDTFLTFDLALDGVRIAYDPHSGSYEEVAPTFKSFVARRRRWSAGHTHAFVRHLRGLFSARLSRGRKLHLFLYGQFFLIPAVVALLNNTLAAYLLVQLVPRLLLLTGIGVLVAAGALVATLDPERRHLVSDAVVALVWTLPQVVLLVVLGYRLSGAEGYYYLLSFPRADLLMWGQGATALMPVVLVLVAAARLGGVRLAALLVFLVTYPLMLFVDIYAGLLGLVDLLFGRSLWTRIERRNVVGPVPAAMRKHLGRATAARGRLRGLVWLPIVALLLGAANELLAVNECGQVRGLLWRPLLLHGSHPLDLGLQVRRRVAAPGRLGLDLEARVAGRSATPLELSLAVDGRTVATRRIEGAGPFLLEHTEELPLGFARGRVTATLSGPELSCRRETVFASSVIELDGRELLVNGEPFLIKGVVNSFSSPQVNLSPAEGLGQLKASGANVVRVYHQPTKSLLEAAAATRTLVIDQPDESTWLNVDVTQESDRKKLLKRYRRLVEETEGDPFVLIDNLGNELDMRAATQLDAIEGVRAALDDARLKGRRFPLGFSTYSTFVDYPVDVLGVNMLDTSETYWTGGLGLLLARGRPFYASEFGGFVAFSESPPTEVRIWRMRSYWRRLAQAGALGACIFESHDNWAQAVHPGTYNDPLTPEQPDDLRGLWDHRNQPKPELRFVEQLFADVEVRVLEERLGPGDLAHLVFRNRRRYALEGVVVQAPSLSVGTLAPGEERTVELPASAFTPGSRPRLRLDYTTHRGLTATSMVEVPLPLPAGRPLVLSDDFTEEGSDDKVTRGRLIDAGELEIVLPPGWSGARVDGKLHEATAGGRLRVALPAALRAVEGLEMSRDGDVWRPFDAEEVAGGQYAFRFKLPSLPAGRHWLVLAGLGSDGVRLRVGTSALAQATHSYRDNLVELPPAIGDPSGAPGELLVDRQMIVYVPASFTPDGRDVRVRFEPPAVYTARQVEIAPP